MFILGYFVKNDYYRDRKFFSDKFISKNQNNYKENKLNVFENISLSK